MPQSTTWLPLEPPLPGPGESLTATARVEEGSPWFDGHFPGRPILPGVAMLALTRRALEMGLTQRGREAEVEGFRRVKFKRVILPGETMTIVLEPGASPREWRFKIAVGEEAASGGMILLRPGREI